MLDQHGHRDRDEPGQERGAGTPDQPRQHVAAYLVGAEAMQRRRRLADRAEVGRDRIERRHPRRGERDDDERATTAAAAAAAGRRSSRPTRGAPRARPRRGAVEAPLTPGLEGAG